MSAQRKPLSLAQATGSIDKNPARFSGRVEPQTIPLGPATSALSDDERKCWDWFRAHFFYLTELDRPIIEVACKLRVKCLKNEISEVGRSQLVSLMGRLGGSPADRTRVQLPEPPRETDPMFD